MLELIGLGVGLLGTWFFVATAVMAGALGAFVVVKLAREVLDIMESAWQGLCRWLGV